MERDRVATPARENLLQGRLILKDILREIYRLARRRGEGRRIPHQLQRRTDLYRILLLTGL
jgi:hypothetical protein